MVSGVTAPARVGRVERTQWGHAPQGQVWLRFVLREGRNRQIRRMVRKVGNQVVSLKRIRIANITLGDLPSGSWRHLTPEELESLLKAR